MLCRQAICSIAAVIATGGLMAAEPTDVTLVRDGKLVELPASLRADLSERVLRLFAACSANSRDHPRGFASLQLPAAWQEVSAKDHLKIQLSKPMALRTSDSAAFQVREFLLGLGDARFPGPHLTRLGEEVVAHGKCSGNDEIEFVCAPGIRDVMPSSYHGLCRHAGQRK